MLLWYVKFRVNPYLILSRKVYAYSYNEAVAKARRLIEERTEGKIELLLCRAIEDEEDY